MDAVILCAGKGKRIPQISRRLQKCMAKIEGKPIIRHTFDHFKAVGIKTVYFVVGYKSNDIINSFPDKEDKTNIIFLHDDRFDSTSNSLLLAEKLISQEFVYSHGEIVYNRSLIEELVKKQLNYHSGVLAISNNLEVAPTHPRIQISGNRIKDMDLNTSKEKGFPFSYMGVGKLNKNIFPYLKRNSTISKALLEMLKKHKSLDYIIYNNLWRHIATKEDL